MTSKLPIRIPLKNTRMVSPLMLITALIFQLFLIGESNAERANRRQMVPRTKQPTQKLQHAYARAEFKSRDSAYNSIRSMLQKKQSERERLTLKEKQIRKKRGGAIIFRSQEFLDRYFKSTSFQQKAELHQTLIRTKEEQRNNSIEIRNLEEDERKHGQYRILAERDLSEIEAALSQDVQK